MERIIIYTNSRKFALLILCFAVLAVFTQQHLIGQCAKKLFRIDPGHEDEFGKVDIDGNIAIVGAWLDDSGIIDHGSAYLFNATTGNQIHQLIQSDPLQFGYYGQSVSVSGSIAIVGALGEENASGETTGAAYLFNTSTGLQTHRLLPSDYPDGPFGYSVDVDETTAIVGAVLPGKPTAHIGSAYLFDVATGTQLHKLVPDDGADFDFFGVSVAICGNYAIVGSVHDSTVIGEIEITRHGSVYVFDVNTGIQIAKLVANDMKDTQHFGQSVAISGSIAIIGAPSNDVYNEYDKVGSAYLFNLVTGQQIARLTPFDDPGSLSGFFGWSVSIDGDRAIVGRLSHNHNGSVSGAAYVYDTNSAQLLDEYLSGELASDDFGSSVGISNDKSIVGARSDFYGGETRGSAYIFDDTDPCPNLYVSPEPIVANEGITCSVNQMTPNTATYLVYSLQGYGSTYVPSLNVTIDLSNPKQADDDVATSDGEGYAHWEIIVPQAGAGHNIWFQVLQFENKSSVVETNIVE